MVIFKKVSSNVFQDYSNKNSLEKYYLVNIETEKSYRGNFNMGLDELKNSIKESIEIQLVLASMLRGNSVFDKHKSDFELPYSERLENFAKNLFSDVEVLSYNYESKSIKKLSMLSPYDEVIKTFIDMALNNELDESIHRYFFAEDNDWRESSKETQYYIFEGSTENLSFEQNKLFTYVEEILSKEPHVFLMDLYLSLSSIENDKYIKKLSENYNIMLYKMPTLMGHLRDEILAYKLLICRK